MDRISIGILGYNEELGIARLLPSLECQTLLDGRFDAEVTVVSNGSTDGMARVAEGGLEPLRARGATTRVVELPVADKCEAWNHFVHRVSRPADYYVLLDADVFVREPEGLERLVSMLAGDDRCRIVGGRVVDDRGRLGELTIDGKCYVARGEILRDIAIPRGVVLDDAYIAATALTHWYELTAEEGLARGHLRRSEEPIVEAGGLPRDRDPRYWIAARKRTLIAGAVQERVDHYMRHVLGGGEAARRRSMALFAERPDWFLEHLASAPPTLRFSPPRLGLRELPRDARRLALYLYGFAVAWRGLRLGDYGHRAWTLRSTYW